MPHKVLIANKMQALIQSRLLILFIILMAVLVRIPHIYGDPPAGDISRSGVFMADEGFHGYNALHWTLAGHPYVQDDINPGVNSPVFTLFEYILLSIFGISLATIRYGAVFCSVLSLVFLYFMINMTEKTAALIALLSGTILFPFIIYNRLALLENLMLCWMVLAMLFLVLYLKKPEKTGFIIFFWIAFFLGFLTKAIMIFLIVPFLYEIKKLNKELRIKTLRISLVCILIFGTGLLFYIQQYREDWMYYQALNGLLRIDLNPLQIVQNYARYLFHLKLFEFMPVLYTLSLLAAGRNFIKLLRGQKIVLAERIVTFWFFAGLLFVGFFDYSPPRYALVLIPAILALNGFLLSDALSRQKLHISRFWVILIGLVVVFQGLFGLYRIVAYEHIFPSCFLPVLGFLPVAMLLKKGINRKRWTVLVCTIFFIETGQMFWYYQNISYTLHHAIQDIKLKIRPASQDIVIAGDSALLLAFELRTRAIDVMYRQDRLHALVKRMQPDYIFLENPRELDRIQQQVSGYFDNIKPIGRYRIMNNYHHGQDAVLYCVVKKR